MRTLIATLLVLAFGASGLPAVQAADSDPARVDPALTRQLDAAGAADRLLVFVHAEEADVAVDAVREGGLDLVDTFEVVGVAVGMGTPAQIRSLRGADGVTYLEADEPIELHTNTSHVATRGEEALQGFSVEVESTPGKGKGKAKGVGNGKGKGPTTTETVEVSGVDGTGVTIAIVDSGIDGTHPMFQRNGESNEESKVVRNLKLACNQTTPAFFTVGFVPGTDRTPPSVCPEDYEQTNSRDARAAQWLDFTSTSNDTDTPSLGGHGTHVAAIAAGTYVGTDDGRDLHGAAPGADLVGLSIGNALSIYGGAAGLNWVVDNWASPCGSDEDCSPIRAVNNSWGPLGGGEFDPGSAVSKIQDELVKRGVTVVWANGNDGGDGTENLSNPQGQSPTGGILSVANYDDGNSGSRDNGLALSSSRGQQGRPHTYPDISAPGTEITAACRPYLAVCSTGGETGEPNYDTISGTSMAAPHITGIVAQLVEADPELAPGEIEDILEDTAHQFAFGGPYEDDPRNPDGKTSFDKGHGLVDVVAAVARIEGVTGSQAAQSCTGGDTVVADARGDASEFVLVDTPAPSEPSLDVVQGRMSWDPGAKALTATIVVDDLTDDPPAGAAGHFFRYYFWHDGAQYLLVAGRDGLGEFFQLRDGSNTVIVDELDGGFDADDDEIRITLPAEDFAEAQPDVAPIAEGALLSGFEILAQRFEVVFTLTADTAGATCPYVIGEGAVPGDPTVEDSPEPEGPVDHGDSDGQLTSSSPTYTWSGGPTTHSWELFECEDFSGPACDVRRVDVMEGGASGLYVSIDAAPDVSDYDIYVTAPDGTVHDSAFPWSDESVWIPDPEPGIYEIEVVAYATVEAIYEGTATLYF